MKPPKRIDEFSGPWRFLSNFYRAEVWFDGDRYPTVEHAYQAAKTLHYGDREKIRRASSAAEAKRMGRIVDLRQDWESIKVNTMRQLLKAKFEAGSELATMLLDTGDALLTEGNSWGDEFWGVCRGRGTNVLGRLLMEVRAELRGAAPIVGWLESLVERDTRPKKKLVIRRKP